MHMVDEGDRPWVMETDGTWRPEQADARNEWEYIHDDMDVDEDESVDTVERGGTRSCGCVSDHQVLSVLCWTRHLPKVFKNR